MKDFLKYTVLPILGVILFFVGTVDVIAQIKQKTIKNRYNNICSVPIVNDTGAKITTTGEQGERYWYQKNVTIILDSSLAKLGDIEKIKSMVKKGFRTWEETGIPLKFNFVDGECAYGYVDGINCFSAANIDCRGTVRDGKEYLGLSKNNSKTKDADIVLDTISDDGVKAFDTMSELQSTIIHEIGHLIGLDHSSDKKSIMHTPVIKERSITLELRAFVRKLYGVTDDSNTGGDKK